MNQELVKILKERQILIGKQEYIKQEIARKQMKIDYLINITRR